jgi:trk system potassium uptake protein TrkA
MKIIIVGAGTIGSNLAKALSEEDHEVYLVEKIDKVANKVDEKVDVKVIAGNGSDPEALKSAAIEEADLVIAVTTSDETNLVVCSLASAFGVKQCIARVRAPSLSQALNDFGYNRFYIDEIINPEEVAACSIVKALETPGTREVADFAQGRILLRSFDIPETSPMCGLKLEELKDEDFPWPFVVVAVLRDGKVLIPKGNTLIEARERIYVLLPARSAGEFLTVVDPNIRRPKKVVIHGATQIGKRVAEILSGHINDIVLLEDNPVLAEEAAGELLTTRVINGAASEADILTESGIEAADAFIAASTNDHSNLVSAVLAKKMGAKTTIITTKQPEYMTIVDSLNIDVIINPRFLAVDQILRLVRGKGISSVTKFIGQDAEALELIPEEGAAVTKAPIKEIKFPANSVIGAVCRGEEVILANGKTQIKAGEPVIVFCRETAVKKLQDIFTHKKFF